MSRSLHIFVLHSSELLTDNKPHGDGLVANGFIRGLAAQGHKLYVATEAVDLQQAMPANVHLRVLGETGKSGLLSRIKYMAAARKWFRQLDADVTIDVVHQLNPVFTGLSLAIWDTKKPLVLGPYVGSWPEDPGSAVKGNGLAARLAARGRNLMATLQQSRAAALLLTTPAAESRVPFPETLRKRTHILPHGLDTEFFRPSACRPSATQDILFLSNLVERKGVLDLIRAYVMLAPLCKQSRLIIAGDGPEMENARAEAGPLLEEGRVLFLGRLTREQSLEQLQQCAIFCQPSHGEPYGMSAAEAMACGKPLVVTNCGGLAHLGDAAGAIAVPVSNPPALAAALKELVLDPERRRQMGLHNRCVAEKTMAWKQVIAKLETIYEQVRQ